MWTSLTLSFGKYGIIYLHCYASSLKHVQALQIQAVHPGPHSNVCNSLPLLSFFFILVLYGSFFTSRTPNKDKKIEQLFFLLVHLEMFMSSAVNGFVHAVRKHSQKVPYAKSGAFRFAWTNRPFQRKRKYAWNAHTRGTRHIWSAIEALPMSMSHTFLWRKAQHYALCRARTASHLTGYPNTTIITQKYNLFLISCKLSRLLKVIDRWATVHQRWLYLASVLA